MLVNESGDTYESNAQLDGQQRDSVLPSTGSFPPPTDSMPSPTGSQPWLPHRANHEQSSLSADSSHQHRQQVELDSMRIMESLGEGNSMAVSQQQPPASAANGQLPNKQDVEQQYLTESSLLGSRQDAPADSRLEVRLLQSTLMSCV